MRDSDEDTKIDDLMLSAFVDGQLDAAQRVAIIEAMDEDEDLREQVYKLQKMKDLMKLSFGADNQPRSNPEDFTQPLQLQCLKRYAAVFSAIVIGLSSGFAGYQYSLQSNSAPERTLAELSQIQGERIILHINESDPKHFESTLAYTEKFLNDHKDNGKAQIEVVANAGGVDLLRADFPLSNKVSAMMDKYDNITFIACTNAINKLRAAGLDPAMVHDVVTDEPALTHIIERLRAGWTYIKVDKDTLRI